MSPLKVIEPNLGEEPRRLKLSALQAQAPNRRRFISEIGLVERKLFAIEEVRERLVDARNICKRAGGEAQTPIKLFTDLPAQGETCADACAVACAQLVAEDGRILRVREPVRLAELSFITKPNVAAESDRAESR